MSDEKKQAEQMTKKLINSQLEDDQKFVDELVKLMDTEPKKIPEPVFREIFLPFFLGEKKDEEAEGVLAHWIGVVGSASFPADVVDVKGETLFQVPPVYDTSRLNLKRERGNESFIQIMRNYRDEIAKTPIAGQNYLNYALKKKMDSSLTKEQKSEHAWDGVFSYYGLNQKVEEQKDGKTDKPDMDDFQFDE